MYTQQLWLTGTVAFLRLEFTEINERGDGLWIYHTRSAVSCLCRLCLAFAFLFVSRIQAIYTGLTGKALLNMTETE